MERQTDQNLEKMRFDNLSLEEQILERTSRFMIPENMSVKEALAGLKIKTGELKEYNTRKKALRFRYHYWILAAEAVLVFFIAIWSLLKITAQTQLAAGKGFHQEYVLPDGSLVSLNSDSKVSYSKRDFGIERHIKLKGEAFFNVKKGSPFIITTDKGSIKVLGTSFNVFVRDNSFRVNCLSGKVLVSALDRSVTVNPGESAELSGRELTSFRDDRIEKLTGWMKGEFYFENSSMNLVLKEIERQFNVKFETGDLNAKFFTGSFTNKDLSEALDVVCIPMGLKYEIGRKGKIFITEI